MTQFITMSYCLNPACDHPQNPDEASYCLNCRSTLLLQGRYRSLKLIGRGGFGRTFLAVDEFYPCQQRCVIKQFFPYSWTGCDRKLAAELFRQEALRLEVLGQHPQIPKLLAYHEQDGQQYLVQEFIDGQNLAQELGEQGAFNEDQIRQLLQNLLPVLQFVHAYHVIHRDIKPANIIHRSNDGQFVLVDFGAAKYATGKALAQTGTVIGSAEYTAPEQLKGKAIFVSDLYSLGVTCIHLLTQVSPFQLYDSSEDMWVWRDYLSYPVSESLGNVLDQLLHHATNRRYQSANEVLNALTFQSRLVALKSLATTKVASREESERQDSVNLTNSYTSAVPVLSASGFDPPSQSWYRTPDLAERSDSDLVGSVATFLRQRSELYSNHVALPNQNVSNRSSVPLAKTRKRHQWFLFSLGVTGLLICMVFIGKLHLYFLDSYFPYGQIYHPPKLVFKKWKISVSTDIR